MPPKRPQNSPRRKSPTWKPGSRGCADRARPPADGKPGEDARQDGMSLEEGRKFWSFQPVVDPPPPQVKNAAWPRTPVDHFILARLEAAGITPAPGRRQAHAAAARDVRPHRPAADARGDRRVSRRRLAAGLREGRGSPARLAALRRALGPALAGCRALRRHVRQRVGLSRAAGAQVSRLGHRAFNRDLPYDQFLREQIAGDLLAGDTDAERSRAHHRHRLSRHRAALRRRSRRASII